MPTTVLLAGIPARNANLYHRVQFLAPDSVVFIAHADGSKTLLVRDIEMSRARKLAHIDRVYCPGDFAPDGGFSANREVGMAQAAAACLKHHGESRVTIEGTLPYLHAHHLLEAGITLDYQEELGELERRIKSAREIEWLRHAQQVTGETVAFACRTIAAAVPDRDGLLHHDGRVLTSERMRTMITAFLNDRNFSNPHDSIVVTLPHVADCHHFGTGPLRVNEPVIVDIFPMDNATRYHGDMTRTVVNGEAGDEFKRMHAAVAAAKQAGCEALRPGTTGDAVHHTTIAKLVEHGYSEKRGGDVGDATRASMRHGTGHGIGLDVHEPILLSHAGGEIHAGEVFTVEPGLYSSVDGGARIEDMVLVTESGHEVLAPLYEGWVWKD